MSEMGQKRYSNTSGRLKGLLTRRADLCVIQD